jgi:transcriptional regulator with XRE-family HTH domain
MGVMEPSTKMSGASEDGYETTGRKPNPVDIHVGSRVRLRRMVLGISQEKLGERMNLTFQQIQKYEKGTNRIGASRLYQLSRILDVPVNFFFEDAAFPTPAPAHAAYGGFREPDTESFLIEFLNSREGLELNKAFVKIQNPKVRRKVIELVRVLSDERLDTNEEPRGGLPGESN